jgi:hypothetical protein
MQNCPENPTNNAEKAATWELVSRQLFQGDNKPLLILLQQIL